MSLYGFEPCESCGHVGATHPSTGGCLAQVVTGIASGRRVRQCPCKVFVPPKGSEMRPEGADE